MDAELYQYIEAYVRRVVEEAFAERDDAEDFLAIPATEPEPPPLSIAVLRTARAQLLGDKPHCAACGLVYDEPMHAWEHRCTVHTQSLSDGDNGRWGDFSYSDHVFLYDVGISLDKEDGGLL